MTRLRKPPTVEFFAKLVLGLGILFVLLRLVFASEVSGHQHYETFMKAARLLWSGSDPYEVDLGFGSDYWFYSPFCGLFFFGLFAFLPPKLGVFLYMGLSLKVLYSGVVRFSRNYAVQFRLVHSLLLVSFLAGAVSWMKLEVFIVGVLLSAFARLMQEEKRGWILSGALLALITQWKFQTLPVLGLLGLAGGWDRPRFKAFWGTFFSVLLLLFLIPSGILGWDENLAIHSHWVYSLSRSVENRWIGMENIYHVIHSIRPSFWDTISYKPIFLGAALLLALAVLFNRGRRDETAAQAWFRALAWGSWFTVVFGPLHQNNANILIFPFLLYLGQGVLLWFCFLIFGFSNQMEFIQKVAVSGRLIPLKPLVSSILFAFQTRPMSWRRSGPPHRKSRS
ncbi:MAG: hypothetical protein HYX41_01245 [Bdellovibrio sp.]|nr:hypothetical protein [Bdellovibrio sp.]